MAAGTGHRALALRTQGALALLRCAHEHPGITRAEAAARLELSSGSASDIMGRLRNARLLTEKPGQSTGGRGRPTTVLVPHPQGPLVGVVEITHAGWRVTTAEVGGTLAPATANRHEGQAAEAVVAAIARELASLRRRHGDRLRVVGVSVPGTVHKGELVQASTLGWRRVDLSQLGATNSARLPVVVGNNATVAGVAEAMRGNARGVGTALHLMVDVGIGGILIIDGVPADGASGAGGEFGHLPLGDPALACPCGAHGCWDLMVDGRAMARRLGRRRPADPFTFAQRTVAAARAGDPAAGDAVAHVTAALGRGIGALINALDPELVTLGGLAADLLDTVHKGLLDAVGDALMTWRRDRVPPIVPAALGSDASAVGAAESAFAALFAGDLPELSRTRTVAGADL